MSKTVPFQTIPFSISTQFSSIRPINWTLSGATTKGHRGPGSGGSKGVLRIPQSSSVTEASPLYCLVSYLGHAFWGGVLLFCREAVYSIAPADCASVRTELINKIIRLKKYTYKVNSWTLTKLKLSEI